MFFVPRREACATDPVLLYVEREDDDKFSYLLHDEPPQNGCFAISELVQV